MKRVLLVARREMLEQRRQPVMLLTVATLYAAVSGLCVAGLFLLEIVIADPEMAATMSVAIGSEQLPSLQDAVLGLLVFLGVSQYLGVASVLAGHGLLHERQCGTLTFLLLAPIQRIELLTGKLLGAVAWPTLLYLCIVGTASVSVHSTSAALRAPWMCVTSAAGAAGTLLAAPAWCLATAACGTLVSALARDVRTAQQGVWFVVFFATLAIGPLLTGTLQQGASTQLVSALAGLLATAALLYSGSLLLSRDVGR